jgi:hypothetical protein
VHAGATSQDVIDTAVVLCLKPACARVSTLTVRLGDAARDRRRHRPRRRRAHAAAAGAAVPFGWKGGDVASSRARSCALRRAPSALRPAVRRPERHAFVVRREAGGRRRSRGARLAASLVPWHSARDRFARLGRELAILAGVAGKIGRDVSLLMQREVGEAAEGAARARRVLEHAAQAQSRAVHARARSGAARAGLARRCSASSRRSTSAGSASGKASGSRCASCSARGERRRRDGGSLGGLEVDEKAMRANSNRCSRITRRTFGAASAMIEAALAEWALLRAEQRLELVGNRFAFHRRARAVA